MLEVIAEIQNRFNNHVGFVEKRPGIYQIFLPLYHEDGDMVDLFITETTDHKFKLTDYGLTLQRLSYTYDIDSAHKEKVLDKIIAENGIIDEGGSLTMETKPDSVFGDIMQITQAYAKVGSMGYFKKEVIENLFFEILENFIFTDLLEFKPEKNIIPIPDRTDLIVDFKFTPNGHPIYLFGVKDGTQAKLTTISCLEFQRANLNYRSCVVNEDFNKLTKNDRTRLTNASDKQFTSLEDFKSSARTYLERERR